MYAGVCYYPEQWPQSQWASDARRMAELGISHVRIAEFAWANMEPQQGKYDWKWLDDAIATLADAGLKIILGTPTAAPPQWLCAAMPQIMPIRADGKPWRFGSRRHYDISSPDYRRECRRITSAMAQRYGQHPAVIAWQTDNELACHDTVPSYSPSMRAHFQAWLEQRYGTVEALNEAWGNVFWSQRYPAFRDIDFPIQTPTDANPSHLLDFRRYLSDEVISFHQEQADLLRQYAPGRDVFHNFMGLFGAFDHYKFAEHGIDLAAWDSYPLARTEVTPFPESDKVRYARTGHPDVSAFSHDLYRGVGNGRFWVMEQQAGPVNWAPFNPTPAAGMVRLWAWETLAHGAEVISWFRWRQAPFAQEQLHSGLNLPGDGYSPGGFEAVQVGKELRTFEKAKAGVGQVAMVFDYETLWMYDLQRHGASFDYNMLMLSYYTALRQLGFDIDILPRDADFSAYALVVVPSLAVVDDALVERVRTSRARWVFGPRTGSRSVNFTIPHELPPGKLQALLPIRVLEVESLRPTLKPALTLAGESGSVIHWRDHVAAGEGAQVLAECEDGWPVLVAKDNVTYAAAWLEPALQLAWLEQLTREAGLQPQRLPDGVRTRRLGDATFVFNYSDAAYSAPIPTGKSVVIGDATVPAQGGVLAYR
ncbi:beta-galactosidase [Amantichitinum ursilacus]|uniref:Beta-galactosidase n=1 Tax=Amantichitinum ursilacus TaxID=857265 RepID=A0A0N0GM57_9NEIS|nr:beta-galactosidase [Amantichitinum ursilacus]KPC50637.1 Beta-galactosidase [Amantichitinum ursilacus]